MDRDCLYKDVVYYDALSNEIILIKWYTYLTNTVAEVHIKNKVFLKSRGRVMRELSRPNMIKLGDL